MVKVLVVEDDVMHITLIKEILGRIGHEVEGISDTFDFMITVERMRPDVILMDLLLSKQHGFTLIRNLRQVEHLASIPVIVITATSLTGLAQQFDDLNCLAYLNKPLRSDILRNLIETAKYASSSGERF